MHRPRSRAAVLACALAIGALATTAAEAKRHPQGHDCLNPHQVRFVTHVGKRYQTVIGVTCNRLRSVRHQKQEGQARFDVSPRSIMRTSAGAIAPVRDDEISARRRIHHHRAWRSHRHHGAAYSGHGDPRPRAWCGWWMRQQLGVRDRRFNLAREWASYGRPAGGPCVGCLVVWRHHVGRITGHDGRNWIVTSGNDGHAVRTRARSVAGAVFRVPG